MFLGTWIVVSIAVLYFLVMIPMQYRYISGLKEYQDRMKTSQYELYEKMTFEGQQLHYHNQGNLWNLPSFMVASLIYKIRHQQK